VLFCFFFAQAKKKNKKNYKTTFSFSSFLSFFLTKKKQKVKPNATAPRALAGQRT